MNFVKLACSFTALFVLLSSTAYAKEDLSDDDAMTCNVIFQMTKASAKDPNTVATADKAANAFAAYLIKQGMKEAQFIPLYDETVKSVQDALSKGSQEDWGKMVDECVAFYEGL